MNVESLYNHIVSQLTPEEALKRLLSSSLRTYEKLKFETKEENGETIVEAVDPIFIIAMATMDLGWNFLIENRDGEADVRGLIVGTDEYLETIKFNK